MSQTAEFLSWSDSKLKLQPRLAESWKPNADGSVVDVQDPPGRQVPRRHADDRGGRRGVDQRARRTRRTAPTRCRRSPACSRRARRKATDASTVEFELDAPNGNFPYLLSSDNYNAIIVPKDFEREVGEDVPRHRPVEARAIHAELGRLLRQERRLLGQDAGSRSSTASEVKFYPKEQAQILALQSGDVDVLVHFSPTGGKALLNDPNITVIELRASRAPRGAHAQRQEAVRRQARAPGDGAGRRPQALVNGLFAGKADFGNDSPFAPVFPSTDKSVPQRKQDLEKAKALMQQAGVSNASVELTRGTASSCRDLAQLLQNDAAKVGHRRSSRTSRPPAPTTATPSSASRRGWTRRIGITDYGHRGVPNVFLDAPLQSKGVWNARALQEPDLRQAGRRSTSRRWTSTRSAPRRRRSRSCCSTRRRSSTRTSTSS